MKTFSKTVSAGARLYYFDVRADKKGNEYVSITEMNTRNEQRSCIYIHREHIDKFLEALNETKVSLNGNVSKC
ncbi:MAG: DUF3276 family protein [Muribaculaceae bacterium]|nr:DUF3276 family protein [Muribaculaceae bacterium]